MKKHLLIALTLLASFTLQATTRKVLFIGNSYVYTNDLPNVLKQLAASFGDTLIYDQYTPGGYTFNQHRQDANTISKIFSQKWDIVILQEQSQMPSFPPMQVDTGTYKPAFSLDSMIHVNDACTETMFYMTWGRKNGDAGNCPFYPPVCTYDGMQTRLRESYLEMAKKNNAIVSPVGAAWKQVRDSFPAIDLYVPDESHPSVSGTYLAACVFYASIFHKNPVASTFNNGLAAADANNLKRIAGKVVLDSFSKWNMYGNYTYANYNKSIAGKTATFINTSVYNSNNYWTFGDGGNSTAASPAHTYTTNGKYLVTLTASNTCFSETKKDTIAIGPVNVEQYEGAVSAITANAIGNNTITLQNTGADVYKYIVTGITGRVVADASLDGGRTTTLQVANTGIYTVSFYNKQERIKQQKIAVY